MEWADKMSFDIIRTLGRIDFRNPLTADDKNSMANTLFRGKQVKAHINLKGGGFDLMTIQNRPFEGGLLVTSSKNQQHLFEDPLAVKITSTSLEQLPKATRDLLNKQLNPAPQGPRKSQTA